MEERFLRGDEEMNKTTHTHKGHCQACGRVQAAANGSRKIAKHGYNTRLGFFMGTCKGSDALALELSHTLTDEIVVKLGEYAAAQTAKVKRLEAGEEFPKTARTSEWISTKYEGRRKIPGTGCYREVAFADATDLQQRDAVKAAINEASFQVRQALEHGADLRKLRSEIFGKKLIANKELNKPAPIEVAIGLKWKDEHGGEREVIKFAGNFGFSSTPRYEVRKSDGTTYRDSVRGIRSDIRRSQASA
jgi:hypothetical protein